MRRRPTNGESCAAWADAAWYLLRDYCGSQACITLERTGAAACVAFGGAGVSVDSLAWIAKPNLVWPAAIELVMGLYFIWTGLRTYRKDPEGKI